MQEVSPDNGYTFSSAEPPLTARIVPKKTGTSVAQVEAALDGAAYQASFKRSDETEAVEGTTTGGFIVFDGLSLGEMETREVPSSDGYPFNREVQRIEVSPEGEFGELAQRGSLIICKGDAKRYDHEDGTSGTTPRTTPRLKAPSSLCTTAPTPPSGTKETGTGSYRTVRWSPPDGVIAVLSTE